MGWQLREGGRQGAGREVSYLLLTLARQFSQLRAHQGAHCHQGGRGHCQQQREACGQHGQGHQATSHLGAASQPLGRGKEAGRLFGTSTTTRGALPRVSWLQPYPPKAKATGLRPVPLGTECNPLPDQQACRGWVRMPVHLAPCPTDPSLLLFLL